MAGPASAFLASGPRGVSAEPGEDYPVPGVAVSPEPVRGPRGDTSREGCSDVSVQV